MVFPPLQTPGSRPGATTKRVFFSCSSDISVYKGNAMEREPGDDCQAYDLALEEEYIDVEVSSSACFGCTAGSSTHSIEFEFHMAANPLEKEPVASPADELFYKGKLLPLHLPPRLQMVQRLLENPSTTSRRNGDNGSPTAASTTANTTPFTSCNISPVNSCHVSGELSPDLYNECSDSFDRPPPKKSWAKRLKKTALCFKLKASRDHLRSLFTRSAACTEETHAVRRRTGDLAGSGTKLGKNLFGLVKSERSQMAGTPAQKMDRDKKAEGDYVHRRSFSGLVKFHFVNNSSSSSALSSSSSSSSSSTNTSPWTPIGHQMPALLKGSGSENSEAECSVQGAIAYCKKTQQCGTARKSFSDIGCCTLSPSRVAAL